MKNTLLLMLGAGLLFSLSAGLQAQNVTLVPALKPVKADYHKFQKSPKDVALKRVWNKKQEQVQPAGEKVRNKYSMKSVTPTEAELGETRYDLQTNQSIQNRIYLYEDGTIGATWTMGFSETEFPDRGTGYNYYNGSSWDASPVERIENKRTGWPSIAALGAGELIVTHNSINGLEFCKRSTKGSGAWTETLFQGPGASDDLSWPRVVTNGTNKETIHLFAVTSPVVNGGVLYNGMDGALVYSRSQDGGNSWDISNVQIPGTDINYYKSFGGDCYSFAEPKGDTLAFVVGDNFKDVFLLKSNDNGTSWTKTMIYQHPFPFFDEGSTLILDTIWVCDGSTAVQIDKDGKAQVFFGLMRVNNADTTDEQTSYWPYTDGLAWWKEGDDQFTTLNVDSIYDNDHLVGWMQDLNGNDTVIGDMTGYAKWEISLTSMPNVCIDDKNDMYLLMAGTMETLNDGDQNYRHVWARKWDHLTNLWGDFFDLNEGIVHQYDDCVFPCISPKSNLFIHYIYQADDEAGLAVRGDEDPYTDNRIIYGKAMKSQFVGINEPDAIFAGGSSISPNPAEDYTNLYFGLNTAAQINISLADINGKQINQWNSGKFEPGNHNIYVPLKSLSPGMYLLILQAGQQKICHKIVVM